MPSPTVFNIPAGAPFLQSLAEGLKVRLDDRLNDALILLPTRRAAKQLGDILVGNSGVSFLPRLRPLADIDPEEPPFEPGFLSGIIRPAMPSIQRRFLLSKLVGRYYSNMSGEELSPAAALFLTDPLLAILDDAAMEEIDLADLSALSDIKDFAAEHFQNAAQFYDILQKFWPNFMGEQNMMEPVARRVALLNALTDIWTDEPPDYPVVVAGSTGTLAATARLIRCVSHMPDGLVVLPNLDKNMPKSAWDDIKEKDLQDHPQKSLQDLLTALDLAREDVGYWDADQETEQRSRRRVISESLVPVSATGDWAGRIDVLRRDHNDGDIFEAALEGLSLIETRTQDEEALCIALILRHDLRDPETSAAFITPDPALARRVRTRLARWNITIEYSQGEPLEETRIGGFLTGLINLAQDPQSPVDLAYIFGHTLTGLGQGFGEAKQEWLSLEAAKFRGLRPKPKVYETSGVLSQLYSALHPLTKHSRTERLAPSLWIKSLTKAAENVAETDNEPGAAQLWTGEAGVSAANLIEDMIAHADTLGSVTLPEFVDLFSKLLRSRVVRPRGNTHPRLQILGPLEARMVVADKIILGGLNEGVWPSSPPHMPFLSRGMRQAIGLSLPERRYGLAAHDFASLACYPDVVLTRSERSHEGPQVASRWIWRLKTLLNGALGEEKAAKQLQPEHPYIEWARSIDSVDPDAVEPAKSPKQKPHPDLRWPQGRELSVTQVKTLIRDPYSIYARYILGLKLLDSLDEPSGPREYGNAIHTALERFIKKHPKAIPANAARHLKEFITEELRAIGFEDHDFAAETVRLEKIASDIVDLFQSRRDEGWVYVTSETKGRLKLQDINFSLIGKPDLVESKGGRYAVIDYKTGAPPSLSEVQTGFDLQMPLLALMLENAAFETAKPQETEQLLYIRVKGSKEGVSQSFLTLPEVKKGWSGPDYASEAHTIVKNLIATFDQPDTPYLSQPRAKYVNDYGDYDDLARRSEWQQAGDGEGA